MKKLALTLCITSMVFSALPVSSVNSFATTTNEAVSAIDYGMTFSTNDRETFIDVAPMYDLPEDYIFEFSYNKELDWNIPSDLREGIKVYADKACTQEISSVLTKSEDKKTIQLMPSLFGTFDLLEEERTYKDGDSTNSELHTWGDLQTYYLKISYDLSTTDFKKLDTPIRMMFTLESEMDAPTPRFDLGADGTMSIVWKPVKGAVKYKIYNGYDINMTLFEEVSGTVFSYSNEDDLASNGIFMNSKEAYLKRVAVVAVDKDGNHSRIAKVLDNDDNEGKLPISVIRNQRGYSSYDIDSILGLPSQVNVEMNQMDSSYNPIVRSYKVLWDVDNYETDEYGLNKYYGQVVGTALKTYYYTPEPTSAKEIEDFKKEHDTTIVKAMRTDDEAQISIDAAPTKEAVKAIERKEGKAEDKNVLTYIEENSVTSKTDMSLEEVILRGWLNFDERINVSDYPEAMDGNYLIDLLIALRYQNPLVQGISDLGFDYEKGELLVRYDVTASEGKAKQQSVMKKVDEVLAEIITASDSDEAKLLKINDWLVKNAEYHDAPLNDYLAGVDQSIISEKYADSFQPAGILLNGTGVCQSYAGVFKLLCDRAGLEVIMVSGDSSGVPHAWNKIKMNDSWVNIDTTFNDNEYIPYPVFGASDKYTGYILDNTHLLDSELKTHESTTIEYDFYERIDLLAETSSELTTILDRVSEKKETILVKVNPLMSDADIEKAITASKLATDSSVEGVGYDMNFLYIVY